MTATERPTCDVSVFLPRRPENFAYLVPPSGRLYTSYGEQGTMVRLEGIPTVSRREQLPDWFIENNCVFVKDDGTPYTDAELDERLPDTKAINAVLGEKYLRRLSFI